MKSEKIIGQKKSAKSSVFLIDCPVTTSEAAELRSKYYVIVPYVKTTQSACVNCIFCREVAFDYCKCVFEDWSKQPEEIQEQFILSYRSQKRYNN